MEQKLLSIFTTTSLYTNGHFLSRYVKFVLSRANAKIKYQTHFHHILPKAKDLFPEYKDLKLHPWNGVHLTIREHYIAHRLLHLAFPGSSQTLAFYNMSNILKINNSKAYYFAKETHIASLKKLHASPERNAKISKALTGKKKSKEHVAKLVGHEVTAETREKLRKANLGKVRTEESKAKQQRTRAERGIKGGVILSEESRAKMSETKQKEKRKWYNNGQVSKSFTIHNPPPDQSWVLGRLPWVN